MVSRKKIFRRRRQGKTDYRKRLKLIKSGIPRASVRITNTKVMIQIIDFSMKGDLILASATSKQLDGFGTLCLQDALGHPRPPQPPRWHPDASQAPGGLISLISRPNM